MRSTLEWEWAYAVGDRRSASRSRRPAAEDAVRDPGQERAVLDALDLPPFADGLLRADGPGSPLLPRVRLDGLDTMRFSTEVLPLLADAPGIVVEVSGRPAGLPGGGRPRSGSASPPRSRRGGTDWFDLGVRDHASTGREVPFAEVFAALAAGESHLLLPDGAYFSLHKPELQALRTLIEEARALQDSPSGPLRLSRFQAGLWEELAALGVVDAQARAWQQQVAGLLAIDGVGGDRTARPTSARSCAPTSVTGSTGCASSGGTGSAACSPTTWGWARRCRRSPSSATRARSSRPGRRS